MKNPIETIEGVRISDGKRQIQEEVIANEMSMKLNLDDEFTEHFYCSPGLETELVFGFLLSSGMITRQSDIRKINFVNNNCNVHITRQSDHIKSSSKTQLVVSWELLVAIRDILLDNQENHRSTRGFHGAVIYEISSGRWFCCEDIGRHNTMDKVLGHALLNEFSLTHSVIIITGRLTSQLVSKTLNVGIALLASLTIATSTGIEKAKEQNLTLIGSLSDRDCWLYNEGMTKLDLIKPR